jgi:hypothetical protein
MGLPFLKTNGLFARAEDGELLFFATPISRSAYVIPDREREEALRTLSRYWGLCELLSVAIIAPVALHFGPLALLVAFALFLLCSGFAYQFALRGLVMGLESVVHEPIAEEHHSVSLAKLLCTVADETHLGLLWLCEVVSLVPLAGGVLMLLDGNQVHDFVGAFVALVFFGSATIAGAYMISMKGRGVGVTTTHSFADQHAAAGN